MANMFFSPYPNNGSFQREKIIQASLNWDTLNFNLGRGWKLWLLFQWVQFTQEEDWFIIHWNLALSGHLLQSDSSPLKASPKSLTDTKEYFYFILGGMHICILISCPLFFGGETDLCHPTTSPEYGLEAEGSLRQMQQMGQFWSLMGCCMEGLDVYWRCFQKGPL